MRILFVCGGTGGGAAMSTHELADALSHAGDDVAVLQATRGADRVRHTQRRLLNASVKLRNWPLVRPVRWAASTFGRRTRVLTEVGARPGRRITAAVVENATPAAIAAERPDVVVANSVDRA